MDILTDHDMGDKIKCHHYHVNVVHLEVYNNVKHCVLIAHADLLFAFYVCRLLFNKCALMLAACGVICSKASIKMIVWVVTR